MRSERRTKAPEIEAPKRPKIDVRELARQKQVLFAKIAESHAAHRDEDFGNDQLVVGRVLEHSLEDGLALMQQVGMKPETMRELFCNPYFIAKHEDFSRSFYHIIGRIISNSYFDGEIDVLEKAETEELKDMLHQVSAVIRNGIANPFADGYTGYQTIPSLEGQKLYDEVDDFYGHYIALHGVKERLGNTVAEKPETIDGEAMAGMLLKQLQLALSQKVYAQAGRQIVLKAVVPYFKAQGVKPLNGESYTVEDLKQYVGQHSETPIGDGNALFESDFLSPELITSSIEQFEVGYDYDQAAVQKELHANRYRIADPVYRVERRFATKTLKKEIEISLRARGITETTVEWNEEANNYELRKKESTEDTETAEQAEAVPPFDLGRCEKVVGHMPSDYHLKDMLDHKDSGKYGIYDIEKDGDTGERQFSSYLIDGSHAVVEHLANNVGLLSWKNTITNEWEAKSLPEAEIKNYLRELGATRPGAPMTPDEMDADPNISYREPWPYFHINESSYPLAKNQSVFKVGSRYFINTDYHGLVECGQNDYIVPANTFEKVVMFNLTDDYMVVGGEKNGQIVVYKQPLEKSIKGAPEQAAVTPSDSEAFKLAILNAVNKEDITLEDVKELVYKLQKKEASLTTENEKKSSKINFARLTKAIKENPAAFADTILAIPDPKFSTADLERIAGLLSPVMHKILLREQQERAKKERGGFWNRLRQSFKGEKAESPSLESFLTKSVSERLVGGDPKSSEDAKLEVMHTRERFDRFIVTNHYGSYDSATGKWQEAAYGLPGEISDPSHEYTTTVSVGAGREMILPAMFGATIIPERVKGVDTKGHEHSLSVRTDISGITTVDFGTNKNLKNIVYSQSVSELPAALSETSAKEYEQFAKRFTKDHGQETREKIAPFLPAELKYFVATLKGKTPKEKVSAIEAYVREIGYYDFDNGTLAGISRGTTVEDRLRFMRERMDTVRSEKKELQAELATKQYAGVCADYAEVVAALLREAGIICGVAKVFRPSGTTITAADYHAVTTVPWPSQTTPEGFIAVPVDGTPGGVTAEEKKILIAIQMPSLKLREEAYEKIEKEMVEEAETQLTEIEKVLATQDPEQIRKLSNGDLEATLNVILERTVKKTHVDAIETVLNTIWYSPVNVRAIDLKDPADKIALLKFMEPEFTVRRRDEKSDASAEKRAGTRLFTSVKEFASRLAKEKTIGSRTEAYDTLDRIFLLAGTHLNDVEKRAAAATVAYLRAKQMVKKKV